MPFAVLLCLKRNTSEETRGHFDMLAYLTRSLTDKLAETAERMFLLIKNLHREQNDANFGKSFSKHAIICTIQSARRSKQI